MELEEAYLLHTRPYRETSLLVDLFTKKHGRVSLVAKGVRQQKSHKSSILQPFVLLDISWYGKGPLYSLRYVEAKTNQHMLTAKKLISGLYLNELLIRLLPNNDSHIDLFDYYQQTLLELTGQQQLQVILRIFEKRLLKTIGYDLQLIKDIESGDLIDQNSYYIFNLEQGPRKESINYKSDLLFKGESLLALHNEVFSSKDHLLDAKRLMRLALAFRLGDKPLQTRKLL